MICPSVELSLGQGTEAPVASAWWPLLVGFLQVRVCDLAGLWLVPLASNWLKTPAERAGLPAGHGQVGEPCDALRGSPQLLPVPATSHLDTTPRNCRAPLQKSPGATGDWVVPAFSPRGCPPWAEVLRAGTACS